MATERGDLSLPSVRVARMMEAWRVAEIVAALPRQAYEPDTSTILQQACIDAFFVNVRALVEFLGIKKSDPTKDFSAIDVAPEWVAVISLEERKRLVEYWQIASQHLMHFSRSRVKQDGMATLQVNVELAELTSIADDVLALWDQYAVHVAHPLSPPRAGFNLLAGSQLPGSVSDVGP